MDIRALPSDQDHIITLFRERGLWGAISKTNHAILRWRDPIYRSARELAMTLRARVLSAGRQEIDAVVFEAVLARALCAEAAGSIAPEDLDWLLVDLDTSPHLPVAPTHALRKRRRVSRVELLSQDVVEWPDPRKKKKEEAEGVRTFIVTGRAIAAEDRVLRTMSRPSTIAANNSGA